MTNIVCMVVMDKISKWQKSKFIPIYETFKSESQIRYPIAHWALETVDFDYGNAGV